MKVKIFMLSVICILLAGIGIFVGLKWDDVIVPLMCGEKIYTEKDISDIEKKHEDALVNAVSDQIKETEKEKSRADEFERRYEEEQRENGRLQSLYLELKNNQASELTQEMFNLLIDHGVVYYIDNDEVFISGFNGPNRQEETIYYNISTKEAHKIDGIGRVLEWYKNDNMLYGVSDSNLIRVNIDTFEGKVLKENYSMPISEVIHGTNSAGKDCLLFYGVNTLVSTPDTHEFTEHQFVELELETETVQIFGDELLNVDDTTIKFNVLHRPENQFLLQGNSDVYRYNQGKFEKCFKLEYFANSYIMNEYMKSWNMEEYCFNNVLTYDNGINNIQFINLENFKTLELEINPFAQYVLFNNQFTENEIYIGDIDGKLYKINVQEMTSEELGTIKGITPVTNDGLSLGRLFFVQNDDTTYSLKLAKYGVEGLENVKDFTSDVEFTSFESANNSIRVKVQEGGQEKVYIYDVTTGEISEEN